MLIQVAGLLAMLRRDRERARQADRRRRLQARHAQHPRGDSARIVGEDDAPVVSAGARGLSTG